MRVLVCGGRDYDDATMVCGILDGINRSTPISILIQGGASGADMIAREWCGTREVPYDNYGADWNAHGRAAGPLRNQRMIDEGKPDLVVAFPGGRGTADMVRRARMAGLDIVQVQKK